MDDLTKYEAPKEWEKEGLTDEQRNVLKAKAVDPFSNYNNKIMELLLLITYLSGNAWVLGYVVMLPLGFMAYALITIDATLKIFETDWFGGDVSIDYWWMGPFLRAFVVGPLYFWSNVFCSAIPGLNFLTPWLFAYLAALDYYGYAYEFFGGPQVPEMPE